MLTLLDKIYPVEKTYSNQLAKILNAYAPVDQEAVELVMTHSTIEMVRKDEMVFHQNRYNNAEYFQLEGISHRFILDADKHAITTGIYQNEVLITPYVARTSNQQSIFSLQALADCTYLKVPSETLQLLLEQSRTLRNFGHAAMEKEFSKSLSFEVMFRSSTAKERLIYFRTQYPMLENIIPHTIIASFLGITPVSLSRLRNELTNQ